MSEEFSDDFDVEEEEEGANRPFLIAAGALVGVFIVIVGCILIFTLLQRSQQAEQIAEIESANATTEAENALVTQTVQALQTEAARPTEPPTRTPRPTATATATATTPAPTSTPVVAQTEPAETPSAELTATEVLGAVGAEDLTPLPGDTGTPETLPDTGLATWVVVIGGLGLIALLVVARRLRMGG